MAKATFAAGDFWHAEEAFRHLPGVIGTTVGFMGGTVPNPTREEVAGGRTGHAEVVEVEFDPVHIEYVNLLDVFWSCHDPSGVSQQGNRDGTPYRSIIFFHNSEQKALAVEALRAEQTRLRRRLVTAILPAATFYPAEAMHQQYLEKHGLLDAPLAVE
jgi:peptide-methionine (S)-S-oxide reductase